MRRECQWSVQWWTDGSLICEACHREYNPEASTECDPTTDEELEPALQQLTSEEFVGWILAERPDVGLT